MLKWLLTSWIQASIYIPAVGKVTILMLLRNLCVRSCIVFYFLRHTVVSRTGVNVQPLPKHCYTLSFGGHTFLFLSCLILAFARSFPYLFHIMATHVHVFFAANCVLIMFRLRLSHYNDVSAPSGSEDIIPASEWDSSWNRVGAVGGKEIIREQDPTQKQGVT